MKTSSSGIIYKTFNYSDKSAVSVAYTKEFGKIKLFMNKIYSKKGGVFKFIPGEIVFNKKNETDLHKFYQFNQYPKYFYFIDTPEIFLRLHLIFEIYDYLNEVEIPYPYLWKLLIKINKENYRKAVIYIILNIIETSGIMFELHKCPVCQKEFNEICLSQNGIQCTHCSKKFKMKLNPTELHILQSTNDSNTYKKLEIKENSEKNILKFLIYYVEIMENKKIKSFQIIDKLL
jgi:DNA repair protein RecO (recombination protein O)